MRALAPLAAGLLVSLARAQVAANAGPDQQVIYPDAATLDGEVVNASPIHWWTADGNHATEDMLLKHLEGSGDTAVGPIRTASGQVMGWPSDFVTIGGAVWGVDVGQRRLYTLDPSTGICTLVGTAFSSLYASVTALAYDVAGDRLFAVDTAKKQLLRFNRTTGQVTTVGGTTLAGFPL